MRNAADRVRRSKGGHNTLSRNARQAAKRNRGKIRRVAGRDAAKLDREGDQATDQLADELARDADLIAADAVAEPWDRSDYDPIFDNPYDDGWDDYD